MSSQNVIMTLYDDDIVPFKHEGKYAWVTLISTKGTYPELKGGEFCMRVVNSPKGLTRSMLANFQDIFYLNTIMKIVDLGKKNKFSEACLASSKIYFERFPTPLCFIEAVRPYGVTAISCLEDYKKLSSVTAMPTQIQGIQGIQGIIKPPSSFILTVPRRYFCCGSLLLLVLAVRIYTLVQLLC